MRDFGPPPLLAALLLGWAAPLTLGFAPPSLPVAYRARGRLAPSVPALRCASSRYLTKGRQQRVRNKYHQTSTLNPKPYTARAEDTPPPSMSVTSVEEGKRRVLQVRKAPKTHVTLSHTHERTRARAHTHTHTHALSLLSLSLSLSHVRVLQAVAKAGTQDVLKAARDLELLAPADDTARELVGGQWALVFSTQTDNTLGA